MNADGLLIVAAIAFLAPLLIGLVPRLPIPAVAVEVVAGIIVGPSVLGIAHLDTATQVLAPLGLAFLFFLLGLDLELEGITTRSLRIAGASQAMSIVIAFAITFGLVAVGFLDGSPVLVAVALLSTSLGVVAPVLLDAGERHSPMGRQLIISGSVSEFVGVIMLSLLFSAGDRLESALLLLGFGTCLLLAFGAILRISHLGRLARALVKLQDTTAQIRVRASMLLLISCMILANIFGVELLLAAFVAGFLQNIIDTEWEKTHPSFHGKLEALGFGFLVPIFFVTTGIQFDLRGMLADTDGLVLIPILVVALLLVRGLPVVLYTGLMDRRRLIAAGLMQSTALPLLLAAAQLGVALNVLDRVTANAMTAAGLISTLVFPPLALAILRRAGDVGVTPAPAEEEAAEVSP